MVSRSQGRCPSGLGSSVLLLLLVLHFLCPFASRHTFPLHLVCLMRKAAGSRAFACVTRLLACGRRVLASSGRALHARCSSRGKLLTHWRCTVVTTAVACACLAVLIRPADGLGAHRVIPRGLVIAIGVRSGTLLFVTTKVHTRGIRSDPGDCSELTGSTSAWNLGSIERSPAREILEPWGSENVVLQRTISRRDAMVQSFGLFQLWTSRRTQCLIES